MEKEKKIIVSIRIKPSLIDKIDHYRLNKFFSTRSLFIERSADFALKNSKKFIKYIKERGNNE